MKKAIGMDSIVVRAILDRIKRIFQDETNFISLKNSLSSIWVEN